MKGQWFFGGIISAGMGLLLYGYWIPLKATLAQMLLHQAWQQSVVQQQPQKPWPWADTRSIARLHLLDMDFVVLSDGGGESLAFAPSHVQGTAMPGTSGTTIIAGHRDTHFQRLPELQVGDSVSIETLDGRVLAYDITYTGVTERPEIQVPKDMHSRIILATCWPINQQNLNPQQRYLVVARVP